MLLIYKGFDNLDLAFKCSIAPNFMTTLEEKQIEARETRQDAPLEYNGMRMFVSESGARGGYAFKVSTGQEGGHWVFKRPSRSDPWGIRVSVRALPLMLYGLGAVRADLYTFLERIGCTVPDAAESIARVDYAMDFLIPEFAPEPNHFVMHSHSNRKDHIEDISELVRNGRSGRVTSVTVGKMPGRQVIVYDKRAEVIASQKKQMFTVWNANLKAMGEPTLNVSEIANAGIWRVEVRAGKDDLKKRWNASTWAKLDDIMGDIFCATMDAIRYTAPTDDTNRSRWPNHALWSAARDILAGDLHEMMCYAEPDKVREVIRDEHAAMLWKQTLGLAITYAVTQSYDADDLEFLPELIDLKLKDSVIFERDALQKKMAKANERLNFIESSPGTRG